MFDSQRNSRCITFWHSSTRNPLDARSRVGATFVILSDTSPIQNLLRTYPRYDLFDSFVPFPWLTFQDFRFVMESKLLISKIVSWIEYKTFDEIRSILSNLDLHIYIYIYKMRLRVYRSLKFYMFQRISNENWNLISRSSVVLKINPRGFENWRGITRTGLSWNAIIDWTCRRGFYGAWCIKGYRVEIWLSPRAIQKWIDRSTGITFEMSATVNVSTTNATIFHAWARWSFVESN